MQNGVRYGLQIVEEYQTEGILPTQEEMIQKVCDWSHLACYGGLYDHMRSAMESFLNFDLNLDGQISFEESNATIEDVDNDGLVHPSEFELMRPLVNPWVT